MKILDSIDRKRRDQVPVISRFATLEPEYRALPPGTDHPTHWRWEYGIKVRCEFTGPEDASDYMERQARRLIAREVFGEITDDLFELHRILMEEGSYRPAHDPAMTIINKLIRKTRGER